MKNKHHPPGMVLGNKVHCVLQDRVDNGCFRGERKPVEIAVDCWETLEQVCPELGSPKFVQTAERFMRVKSGDVVQPGRMDLLLLGNKTAVVVDYKTDRKPDYDRWFGKQVISYCAGLAQEFPGLNRFVGVVVAPRCGEPSQRVVWSREQVMELAPWKWLLTNSPGGSDDYRREIDKMKKRSKAAAGICLSCSEPAVRWGLCAKHWAINKVSCRVHKAARVAAGLCMSCSAPATRAGYCAKHWNMARARRLEKKRQAEAKSAGAPAELGSAAVIE